MKDNKPQNIQRRPVINRTPGDGYINIREKPEQEDIDEFDSPTNEYHLKTAYKIKAAKWAMTVFLIVFSAAGLIFNSGELTAVNFNQLMTYINRQTAGRTPRTEFTIEADEASGIGYHRNNIAVLRKNRLDIYDINGRRNSVSRHIYSNPAISASEKYIIAYDLGMNKMEVFNSFARVHEYRGDGPIYGAQVTSRGNIVYITSEAGYNSAVYIMDAGFNNMFECKFGEDFVVSADIDDKAERLATAGFFARNGDYLSRISIYDTSITEPLSRIEIIGEQPYGVRLTENGVYAVFENSFRIYDRNGSHVLNYNFEYRNIRAMQLMPSLAAVVLNEKTLGIDDRILIFDETGDILYDGAVGAEIRDIQFSEDFRFLYFLTRTGLYEINIGQKTFELVTNEYDETANNIIYANDRNIFLSGLTKVNIIEVN